MKTEAKKSQRKILFNVAKICLVEKHALNKRQFDVFNNLPNRPLSAYRSKVSVSSEDIKAYRDSYTYEMYGMSDREFDTYQQFSDTINKMKIDVGLLRKEDAQKAVATHKQIKLLKMYALSYGIEYHDWDSEEWTIKSTGQILSGDELKTWVTARFFENEASIPNNIYINIFKKTVNPKSHEYMIDAEYKKSVKNENRFYYEYLTPNQAQYLINRYKMMYQNLRQQHQSVLHPN